MEERLHTIPAEPAPSPAGGSETTDTALFVRTSSEGFEGWNRVKIVDALVRETYVDRDTAEKSSSRTPAPRC